MQAGPPRWWRTAHFVFHPAPPLWWSALLWFMVVLAVGFALGNTGIRNSGAASSSVGLVRAAGGEWKVPTAPVYGDVDRWRINATTEFDRQRMLRVTVNMETVNRSDAAGRPLPPPTDAEVIEARRAALALRVRDESLGPWQLSPGQEARVRRFLLESTETDLVVWTLPDFLHEAGERATSVLICILPLVGLVRVIRRRRIRRRLLWAEGGRCPVCGYDLTASFPRLRLCPECGKDFAIEFRRLERLLGY